LTTASRFGVWDPLLCTLRAAPGVLKSVGTGQESRPELASLLRRANDFDLARLAGIDIGRRPRAQRAKLSPRENEILELMRMGLKNREIAQTLFISQSTVKIHVHRILEKLEVRTRTEAITRLLTKD